MCEEELSNNTGVQARLEGLVGKSSGLIETLPKPIQRRIKYLHTLQGEYDQREEEYEKELDELDKKYEKIYGEGLDLDSVACFLWKLGRRIGGHLGGGQSALGKRECSMRGNCLDLAGDN
jgi:hypothetical protein